MPIFLYDVEVYSMPKIIINAPLERGMIEIGKPAKKSFGKTKISGSGKLIFAGRSIIWEGCHIEVYGKFDLRENVQIGVDVSIFCFNEIIMKANSRIGFDSVMMDSDFHYVLNMQSGLVANNKAPIILEESAWVGSHCRLYKNTHIPSYSIVASNSLVNRDFKTEPSFTFFGGSPAKPIRYGITRIFNEDLEHTIDNYYRSTNQREFSIDCSNPNILNELVQKLQ